MRARRVSLLFVSLALACPRWSEAEVLTLADAIVYARGHHPAIVEADALRLGATAQAGTALAAYLPSLDLSVLGRYDYSDFNPVVVGTPSATTPALNGTASYPFSGSARYYASLSFTQLIVDGGGTLAQLAAARASAIAANATLEARRLAVEGAVVAAYFAVLEAKMLVAVNVEYEARTTELVRSVRSLVKGGVRPEVDALSAEVRHQRAGIDRLRLENVLEQRRIALVAAMGLDRDDGAPLVEALVSPLPEESVGLDELTRRAFDSRQELVQLRAEVTAATARVSGSRSDYFPTISLGLTGLLTGTNDVPGPLYSLFGYVALKDNLFGGLATYRAMQNARAQRDAAQARLLQSRTQIRSAVASARSTLRTATEVLDKSRVLVEQTERAVASAQRRYDIGLLSFLELIDLYAQRVAARTAEVQARYALAAARADLLRSVGGTLSARAVLGDTP